MPIVASVVSRGLTPILVIVKPLSNPHAAAEISATNTESQTGRPATIATATTTPVEAKTDPTDKSKPPETKAIVIPVTLHRLIVRLGIHREIEKVVGVGAAMLAGIGLVALSMVVMLRVTQTADPLAREDLAFALAVVLLGLLMMVTRRNAVSQVVGFMSLENGLVLAATGAKGMPLVVEISVAFSILIAFIVIGIFLFRIRERFDTIDVQALDRFRGERR